MVLDRWAESVAGTGQVVVILGEAGIGKTRLLDEVLMDVAGESITMIKTHCTPVTTDSPFHPVIELLRSRLGFQGATKRQQVERLTQRVSDLGFAPEPAVPLLASLLSVELDPAEWPSIGLSPARARQGTIELIIGLLVGLASSAPVLLIIEDLHWADPSTMDLLDQLMATLADHPVMLLLSARPEFHNPWTSMNNVVELSLEGLVNAEAELLIRLSAGDKLLPSQVVRKILARSGGNPLFLEEITRSFTETESADRADAEKTLDIATHLTADDLVPASMEAALMSRMDHLGDARSLLQLGATIGREFSYQLLAAVSTDREPDLSQNLQKLMKAGFVYRQGSSNNTVYVFKHVLVQEFAYNTLLKKSRKKFHSRIAKVLQEQFPEATENRPELLAHHLSGAGNFEGAAQLWQLAGERAAARNAVNEAEDFLRLALADLCQAPENTDRMERELTILTTMTPVLMSVHGWGAPEVGELSLRAAEIASGLGDLTRRYAARWGLWSNQFVSGSLLEAMKSAATVMDMIADIDESSLRLSAYHALAFTRCYRGEYDEAIALCEQAMKFWTLEEEMKICTIFQIGPAAPLLISRAVSNYMKGYQEDAMKDMAKMMELTRQHSHPGALAAALAFQSNLHFYMQQWPELYDSADSLFQISSSEGYSMWLANAGLHRCYAGIRLGKPNHGLSELLDWDALFQTTKTGILWTSRALMIADCLHREGRSNEAIEACSLALEKAEQGMVLVMQPELHRLQADIFAESGNRLEASYAYQRAVECACEQGARTLQVRALVSYLAFSQAQNNENRELAAQLQCLVEQVDFHPSSSDYYQALQLLEVAVK